MCGEIEFYADDIETTCPICGSNQLEPDTTGTGEDVEFVGVTCLGCFTTFGYRADSDSDSDDSDTVDDDEIPW